MEVKELQDYLCQEEGARFSTTDEVVVMMGLAEARLLEEKIIKGSDRDARECGNLVTSMLSPEG